MPAKVVNDNAYFLSKRGALESIASKLAPTVPREATSFSTKTQSVGAGVPAMVVNDNASEPDKCGVLESIAGKPAPTVPRDCVKNQKKDTG